MNAVTVVRRAQTWSVVVRNKLCAALALIAVAASAQAAPLLSSSADFKLLSWLGFKEAIDGSHPEGSTLNVYAWSMAWFKGKLYVGTLRNNNDGTIASLAPLTAQLWAYTPGGADGSSGKWALALQSPPGVVAPRDSGYRWMTVCSFNGQEYLFISALGFVQGNVLRTADGVTFTPLSRVGYPANTVGFRTVSCFTETGGKQLLVVSPVGKAGDATTFDTDASDNPIVLVNDDPINTGTWRNYSALRMGDPNNGAFFTILPAGGYLYAAVNNDITGAQVWRTRGCVTRTACVPDWTKVIDRGLGRPVDPTDGTPKNVGVSDMMLFGDSIYMGVDVPDRNKPPAEMWKLRISDNTAQVVIGEPRFDFGSGTTPSNSAYPSNLRCGVPLEDLDGGGVANDCPPTSRRGAGFGPTGNQQTGYPVGTNSYFWRLLNYAYDPVKAPLGDNRLYAGTLDFSRSGGGTPGFDIVASPDGTNWVVVTNDGAGDSKSAGMRAIASSPVGLFIGSANPARTYDPNTGGTNVWLGIPGSDKVAPATTITSPPSPNEGDTVASHSVSFSWSGSDTPSPGSLPLTYAHRLDPVEPSFSAFGAATGASYTQVPNGVYTFYVIAKDQAGNTETPGAAPGASNRRTITINAPDLPPTVSIQSAPSSPNASGNVSFSWKGSDDLTPVGALTYDFWLAPLQSNPATFVSATSAAYNNLADGAYVFHVVPRDGTGNVGVEATASFTVAHPPGPPASPTPATASVISPGVVRVSWANVASETSYNVERCQSSPFGGCFLFISVGSVGVDVTLLDNTPGGAANSKYIYRVQACNASGCSAYATTSLVTVP